MNSGTFVGLASCAIGALMRMAAGAEEFIEGDYTYITNSLGQAVVTGFDTAYQGDLAIAASLGGFLVSRTSAPRHSAPAPS